MVSKAQRHPFLAKRTNETWETYEERIKPERLLQRIDVLASALQMCVERLENDPATQFTAREARRVLEAAP